MVRDPSRTARAVRWFEMTSPVGDIRGAITPNGLALLDSATTERWETDLARLAHRYGGEAPEQITEHPVIDELRAYFVGDIDAIGGVSFDTPIDYALCRPFAREVLRELRAIPHGELTTYGDLAQHLKRPGAARAVGRAVGSNPMPVVIPCHRVVGSNGRLGGFSWGLERKRTLLEIEGHSIVAPSGGDETSWSNARVRTVAATRA